MVGSLSSLKPVDGQGLSPTGIPLTARTLRSSLAPIADAITCPKGQKSTRVKSDWRQLKQPFFGYIRVSGICYCLKLTGGKAGIGLRRENFGFLESKKLTSMFVILDIICRIFNKISRNSSFTGSVGLIIASSRSGTCFSSCLTSSIYFSIRKSMFFIGLLT